MNNSQTSWEEVNNTKNSFLQNHEERMRELNNAIASVNETKLSEKKTNQMLKELNEMLKSL